MDTAGPFIPTMDQVDPAQQGETATLQNSVDGWGWMPWVPQGWTFPGTERSPTSEPTPEAMDLSLGGPDLAARDLSNLVSNYSAISNSGSDRSSGATDLEITEAMEEGQLETHHDRPPRPPTRRAQLMESNTQKGVFDLSVLGSNYPIYVNSYNRSNDCDIWRSTRMAPRDPRRRTAREESARREKIRADAEEDMRQEKIRRDADRDHINLTRYVKLLHQTATDQPATYLGAFRHWVHIRVGQDITKEMTCVAMLDTNSPWDNCISHTLLHQLGLHLDEEEPTYLTPRWNGESDTTTTRILGRARGSVLLRLGDEHARFLDQPIVVEGLAADYIIGTKFLKSNHIPVAGRCEGLRVEGQLVPVMSVSTWERIPWARPEYPRSDAHVTDDTLVPARSIVLVPLTVPHLNIANLKDRTPEDMEAILVGTSDFMDNTGLHPWTNAVVSVRKEGQTSACAMNTTDKPVLLKQGTKYGMVHLTCSLKDEAQYPGRMYLHDAPIIPEMIDLRQNITPKKTLPAWMRGCTNAANRDLRLQYLLRRFFKDPGLDNSDDEVTISLMMLTYWEVFDWGQPFSTPEREYSMIQSINAVRSTDVLWKQLVRDMTQQMVGEQQLTPWTYHMILARGKLSGVYSWYADFRWVMQTDLHLPNGHHDITQHLVGNKVNPPSLFSDLGAVYQPTIEVDALPAIAPGSTPFTKFMAEVRMNNTSTYGDLVQRILTGLPHYLAFPYFDDPLIYSSNIITHVRAMDRYLKVLRDAGLKIRPERCLLAHPEATITGHRITEVGITMDQRTRTCLLERPTPRTHGELQLWINRVKYYSHFLERYHQIMHPLHESISDAELYPAVFIMKEKMLDSIKDIRAMIARAPVLRHISCPLAEPLWMKITRHQKTKTVSAILSQRRGDEDQVVRYGSLQLNADQAGYPLATGHLYTIAHFLNSWAALLGGRYVQLYLQPMRLDIPARERCTPTEADVEEWMHFTAEYLHPNSVSYTAPHTTSPPSPTQH